ncbi:MAG: exosortase A [Vicinamibacterales bacterium]
MGDQHQARLTPGWRETTVVLAGCLVLLVAIHYDTVIGILRSWSRDPLAHGYFVLPATAYVVWNRLDRLRSVSPRPAFATLALIAALSFGWLVGNLTHTTHLEQIPVVLLFVAVTWGLLGSAAARALMFPLGVLLFALPLGERLAPVLQDLTARLAVHLLTLTGVPAVLSGNVIAIPGTRWHVSEACGGINYVTASLLVGYLYAGSVYHQWAHRIGFVVAAALTPVAGNLRRVHTTILLDYAGATDVASGMRHNLYGLFLFTVMMVILFVTCGRWREATVPPRAEPDVPPRDRRGAPAARWRLAVYATSAVLVVASGPASARMVWASPESSESLRENAPTVGDPWRPIGGTSVAWTPPATGRSASAYAYAADRVVQLHVASYGADAATGDLVSDDILTADPRWWTTADRHRSITWRDRPLRVRELERRSADDLLLVWYWYAIDGHATGDDHLAKLLLARERLLRRPRGGDRMVVFTRSAPEADAAQVLQAFVAQLSWSSPTAE